MLAKYIEPFPFFMAIFFGLMMCYVMTPAPQIVFKHPTPENANDVIYHDESDNCYKYEVDEVVNKLSER
mgnify:CR=1 FL=1